MDEPLLRVRGLCKSFPVRRGVFQRVVGQLHATWQVDLDLAASDSLGLVGESGCGKTTTGRCLLRLLEPTAGSIRFEGQELTALGRRALRRQRRRMQMIFQDPYSSLNPRLTVGEMIAEPMLVHGLAPRAKVRDRVEDLLVRVDLDPACYDDFPHQFSGGQRQRIGIARALALQPGLIICDEPVSALDVSVQAQVINLLQDLQETLGIAYIFIAHDLAVVAHLCRRIAIMYMGEIVEYGDTESIYNRPLHPYTKVLLSAIPPDEPGQERARIAMAGEQPSPLAPPSPERYRQRFPEHAAAFVDGPLELRQVAEDHWVRCVRLEPLLETQAVAGPG